MKRLASLLSLSLGIVLIAAQAHAGLMATITDSASGDSVTIIDEGINDGFAGSGAINFGASVGSFQFIFQTALSTTAPSAGTPRVSLLNTFTSITRAGFPGDPLPATTLTITIVDDMISGPIGPAVSFNTTGNASSTAGLLDISTAYDDGSGLTNIATETGVATNPNVQGFLITPITGGLGGSFAIQHTIVLDVAEFATGTTSLDITTTASVPEPMTLGLVGIGLFGAGCVLRRRRRRVAST